MSIGKSWCLLAGLLVAWPSSGRVLSASPAATESPPSAQIVQSLESPALRALAVEILERNPVVAAASARARAAASRAPQAVSLPDPVVTTTAFLQSPETRTGPQRLSVAISQAFPWGGKRELREEAELYEAAALESEVEALRLKQVTEMRRLVHELAFLDRYTEISETFLAHLERHEEVARARYASGVGFGQGVVKLHAEMTRAERTLLDIDVRRAGLGAQLNALRDMPAVEPLPGALEGRHLRDLGSVRLDVESLMGEAVRRRPEVAAAEARQAAADAIALSAQKDSRPDFTVGLTYTVVDPRDDRAGTLQPPDGNGDDIVGIQGGIRLPLWRDRLAAGVEETEARQVATREAWRSAVAAIRAEIGDLAQRVPLSLQQLRLVEELLVIQAEEAVESAQAGYVAGTLNALDLLDAEHVLFEAQTAIARARADHLIAVARLEGAVGAPIELFSASEGGES